MVGSSGVCAMRHGVADPTKVVCGSYHTKFAEGHMGIAKCPHGVCVCAMVGVLPNTLWQCVYKL